MDGFSRNSIFQPHINYVQILIDLQTAPYANALKALHQTIARPRLILESVGLSLLNATQERHTCGLAPDGTPWAPLAKSTLYKAREARQHTFTRIGNNDPKAAWHHTSHAALWVPQVPF